MSDERLRAGSLRIISLTPDPVDARVDVMQADGTWLPLPICGVDVRVRADELVTASILVEPSSVRIHDTYAPMGYLTGDDERTRHIDYVTLDGERIGTADVMAADDITGWVNVAEKAADGRDVLTHRRGAVRFVSKGLR